MTKYRRIGAPFRHERAIDVSDCSTSRDVMIKAKLDWTVQKVDLYGCSVDENGEADYNLVPNHYGIARMDNNSMLGVVKQKYETIQNIDAFSFFDGAIGFNKAAWQTAGSFGRGERIFVSAILPKNIIVGANDVINNYLVFMTSHDGSMGVKIILTPIRIICQNTLNAAISAATAKLSIRHTLSVKDKLNLATDIMRQSFTAINDLDSIFNRMKTVSIQDESAYIKMAEVIFTPIEISRIYQTGHTLSEILQRNYRAMTDAELSSKKVNSLISMIDYYHTGIGQSEIQGTAWGVYNAVSGYYSNIDVNNSSQKRMDSLLIGDKSRRIDAIGKTLITL